MRGASPAWLRRSELILRWLDREQTDAEVFLGARSLGRWRLLSPSWRRRGGRIDLSLRADGGRIDLQVRSVHSESWGFSFPVQGPRVQRAVRLQVVPLDLRRRRPQPAQVRIALALAWIRRRWPGSRIMGISFHTDRSRSFSASFARVRLHCRGKDELVLFDAGTDATRPPQPMLTQALLWLEFLRSRNRLRQNPGITLIARPERCNGLKHRVRMLDLHRCRIQVVPSPPVADHGVCDFQDRCVTRPRKEREFRWPLPGPLRRSPLLGRVLDLAPGQIQRYPRFAEYDSLRLRGLEFARAHGPFRDRLTFGAFGAACELRDDNFGRLSELVDEILYFRRPDCPDTRHPFFRSQSERWLESLILDEADRLFPELTPGTLQSQIPVYLDGETGRVDLLGVHRGGTLVIMELKTTEDRELLMQALDYWGRVLNHNRKGDFRRRGFFAGTGLSQARPLIYLVHPVFSLHRCIRRLRRYVDSGLEIWKIAVNEDWRSGVRILNRAILKCGDTG